MQGGSGRASSVSSTFDHWRPISRSGASSSPAPFALSHLIAGPSRSSSVTIPSPNTGPRFRTIVHPERHVDRELRHKLLQSRARLDSAFDAIAERYSSVQPEDDDEVDLWDFTIAKDRGALETLEARPFAEGSEFTGEAVEDDVDGVRFDTLRLQTPLPVMGPDKVQFGQDEDELGDWGENSGLDPQYPAFEIENDWTAEDLCDLDSFLRAEAARRERNGEEPLPPSERPSMFTASSPSRRLGRLAIEDLPSDEEDDEDAFEHVLDESESRKGSRVVLAGKEKVSTDL